MGNCQAAEAATIVIQHPAGNKVERFYSSVTARNVMESYPGHFVALVVAPPTTTNVTMPKGVTVKHLKLLRPNDALLIGQVYRLVSVQDVLKEFAAKKCVKLGKLLEGGGIVIDKNKFRICSSLEANQNSVSRPAEKEEQRHGQRRGGSSNSGGRGGMGKNLSNSSSGGQWKPALQSISELGI